MKCIIDNAAIDGGKLSSISVTFGDINSDINIPLKRSSKIKTNPICGSWLFTDWVDKDPFTLKLIQRCDDAVKGNFYKNGCVRCIKADLPLSVSSSALSLFLHVTLTMMEMFIRNSQKYIRSYLQRRIYKKSSLLRIMK